MAGKHRGPSHRGKRSNLRRVTLEPLIQRAVLRMAAKEQRSVGNTISVLVTEAVLARQRRKQRQRARKAGLKVDCEIAVKRLAQGALDLFGEASA